MSFDEAARDGETESRTTLPRRLAAYERLEHALPIRTCR